MKARIVCDITSIKKWIRPPVGIIRTQFELAKYLSKREDIEVVFFCFSDNKDNIMKCPGDEIEALIQKYSASVANTVTTGVFANANFGKNLGTLKLLKALKVKSQSMMEKSTLLNPFLLKLRKIKKARKDAMKTRIKKHKGKESPQEFEAVCIKNQNDNDGIGLESEIIFQKNDTVISIGLDWMYSNYDLLFRLKRRIGFKFMGIFNDGIVLLYPELSQQNQFQEKFFSFFMDLVRLCDSLIVISNYALDQFETCIKMAKITYTGERFVNYLGSSINSHVNFMTKKSRIEYILYVSTFEIRKNHQVILDAIIKLKKQGVELPRFIFIGFWGWGMEQYKRNLEESKLLNRTIFHYQNVKDSELEDLYHNALFCIFPSKEEGWGLGAAEALGYGKYCIISECPALTEATQGLVNTVPAASSELWANEIRLLLEDREELGRREKKVQKEYVKRSWDDFCHDVVKQCNL